MKLRHSLSIFGLVAMLGLGVGVGLASEQKPVSEAKATGESGTMLIDLSQSSWSEAACNVALRLANSDWSEGTWSSYVAVSSGDKTVSLPFTTTFDISKLILVRYNSAQTEESWSSSDKWQNIWNQTFDLDYSAGARTIVVGSWDEEYKKNNASLGNTVVMGGKSGDPWSTLATLGNTKTNTSSHLEFYSDSVSMTSGQSFKVVYAGTYYGDNYATADSLVSSCFTIDDTGDDGDILCKTTGTYSIYFDTNTKHFYINDPVAAAADEWAQTFLATGCVTASTGTKAKWGDHATTYAALDPAVKALFVAEKHVEHDASTTTYLAAAVQRYDYVLQRYGENVANTDALGYEDFMGRVDAGKVTPKTAVGIPTIASAGSQQNNTLIIVIAISSVAVLAVIGGYFYFRKRKEDR